VNDYIHALLQSNQHSAGICISYHMLWCRCHVKRCRLNDPNGRQCLIQQKGCSTDSDIQWTRQRYFCTFLRVYRLRRIHEQVRQYTGCSKHQVYYMMGHKVLLPQQSMSTLPLHTAYPKLHVADCWNMQTEYFSTLLHLANDIQKIHHGLSGNC